MIFFSMEDELVKVDDKNENAKTVLKGLQPVSLAYDPHDINRLYCGTFGRGLWRSIDAGENWEPIAAPHAMGPVNDTVIPYPNIMSLTVSTKKSKQGYGVVYAGTEPSAIFCSEDGGDTWQEFEGIQNLPSKPLWSFPPRPHTSHVRWLGIHPIDTDQLFAAIEFGAFLRSFDGGEYWEDRKFNGPLIRTPLHCMQRHLDVFMQRLGMDLSSLDVAMQKAEIQGRRGPIQMKALVINICIR